MAEEGKPGETATPAQSRAVRLLNRFGIVLPADWSATKADIVGKIIIAVSVGVISTAISASIYKIADLGGNVLQSAWRTTVNYVVGLPKADPNAPLSVLVARLAGDDGSQTERVRVSLRRAFGSDVARPVQVLEVSRPLARGTSGDDLRDRGTAEAEGRRWLKDTGADILIWGEIAAKDKVYRLRFIQNAAQADRGLRESYLLNDTLELAKDFQDDVALVVAAQVTNLAAPIFDRKRQSLDALLDNLYARLSAMHRQAGPASGTENACQVRIRLAAVALTIGDLRDATDKLAEAIEFYRSTLNDKACSKDREFVPSAKNDLGYALQTLGRHTSDAVRFEEAAATYREVLREFSRERAPQQWARTQNNLGVALQLLGLLKQDKSILEESIKAHRSALEVLTRDRSRFDWAILQSNLGTTFQALGMIGNDLTQWNEALKAYSLSLEEFTEEETPVQWATTQFYVAIMLYEVGQRLPDTPRLAESVAAFHSAIKVFEAANDMSRAQVARTALSIAEKALAERRKSN